ncbi:multicopper oxidase domain-containing protein [Moorena sp. SIO3B2]|uniref:multicopper oxidase domain-containing protein n=1 Tax=Moorena sp. SIO3B2 TaxID=2607827 RepID=UPI0013C7A3DA|nr:multicopper oxidase domain-containing protein [Moorena sp. SIO3B2]NEP36219.1 multicopper oxidase domain-containing protein [Moorena sp. SIO3B2]
MAVSTFTGKAVAVGEGDTVRPFVNVCTLRRPDPSEDQPDFKNPPFADADNGPVTLRATQADFTLEGNGKGEQTYQGYLYGAKYTKRDGTVLNDEQPLSYTPPVIEVSPSQEREVGGKNIIVDNNLNVDLINDLPVNVQLAGKLPQTKENLESVSQYTNLHYHGFNVSPLLGADDVLVEVHSNVTPKPEEIPLPEGNPLVIIDNDHSNQVTLAPTGNTQTYDLIPVTPLGQTTPDSTTGTSANLPGGYYPGDNPSNSTYGSIADYNMGFLIPDIHQSGLFWYHSHAHSMSDNQVRGGLSGGIIIKGNDEYYEQFAKPVAALQAQINVPLEAEFEANSLEPQIAQQVMTFKDFNDVLGTGKEDCFVLNSQVNPKITIKPGEIQLWRIANIGADRYMNIALESIKDPGWSNTLNTTELNITDASIEVDEQNGNINGTISFNKINLSASNQGSLEGINATNVTVIDNSNITDVKITSADLNEIVIKADGSISGKIKKAKITASLSGSPAENVQLKEGSFIGKITNISDIQDYAIPKFTQPWGNSNFYILARDGDVVANPVATNSVLLPPAARVELLVVGGPKGSTYNLVSDLDTDLTTKQQQWVNLGNQKSYLLATVEVEGDDVQSYTYKPDGSTVSVCEDGSTGETCSDNENTNLDYFIKNQEPLKIDKILPDPDVVAKLPSCNELDQLTVDQKDKLREYLREYLRIKEVPDQELEEKVLYKACITPSNAYTDPRTQKRYFYFSSGDGKFFLKGFETQAEAHLVQNPDNLIDNEKIKEVFDGNRIDKISNVGDIEEWHLVNTDDNPHVFHIHQLDFVVTKATFPVPSSEAVPETYNNYQVDKGSCDDSEVTLPYRNNHPDFDPDQGGDSTKEVPKGQECNLKPQGYRDVINLPPHSVTTVRIPFVNPFITGVFVYHCHILAHEDRGMMHNLKVINPKAFSELNLKRLKGISKGIIDFLGIDVHVEVKN